MHDELWLGSLGSADGYLKLLEYLQQNPRADSEKPPKAMMGWGDDDDEESEDDNSMQPRFKSHLLEAFGNVAVMNISGGMTNRDTWLAKLFGMTTYPEIIRATAELAEAEDITDVVLNIDSGGGTVAGMEDASRALAMLASIKPMYAATSGQIASAAYWLATNSKSISSTEMAMVGSIGAMAVHITYYRQAKEDGVDATVIRAGKYKALGHPLEELTEEAKAEMQAEIDKLYGFFLNQVALTRNLSLETKDDWAEGRMFFGQEASAIGLVDRIKPPEAVIRELEAVPGEQQTTATETGEYDMSIEARRAVLLQSEEDRAALAAGASLDDMEHEETETTEEGTESGDTQEATAEGAGTEAGTEAVAEAAPAEAAPHVITQLTELSAENALLKRDLDESKAALSALQADSAGMKDIVGQAINRMEIGLKATTSDIKGMSSASLIAKYDQVKNQFDTHFKVGRQTTAVVEESSANVHLISNMGIIPKAK